MNTFLCVMLILVHVCQATVFVNVTSFYGACSGYSVMAGTAVSFDGAQTSVATGDIGVSPGTSISGNYALGSGAVHDNDQSAVDCAASMLTSYDTLQGLTCLPANTLASSDLAGVTLLPAVYCSSSGFLELSASTVTLDGGGDSTAQWVFQTSTSVSSATVTSFILINGAKAINVFWAVGSSASLGYSSSFVGNIFAYTSINVDTSTSLYGRAMAQAAVTFAGGDTVTLPTSAAVPTAAPNASPFPTRFPTSTPSSPTSDDKNTGLSGGAIAGIVIGSVAGAIIIAAIIYYCLSTKPSSNIQNV
jgi:hypothetical protein